MTSSERVAMVLSGGIGLGAYQAGAYAALHQTQTLLPQWLAASSVGAVNAALIAGSPPEDRVRRLQQFWNTNDPPFLLAQSLWGQWPHWQNWINALRGRVFGVQGHFHPRVPLVGRPFQSIYDLTPMRDRLRDLVDFERLNHGPMRVTVATTDIASGETVLFDTARGARIGLDHLMASCGFLPEFMPMEIDGRLLGDGGLSVNAPVEAVLLDDDRGDRLVCFVVDLYARDGTRPASLEEALARKSDLMFANQTYRTLQALKRESDLRLGMQRLIARMPKDGLRGPETAALARHMDPCSVQVLHMSYRAPPEEAGSERPFDLSPASVGERWRAGALDMAEALSVLSAAGDVSRQPGIHIWPVRRAGHEERVVPQPGATPSRASSAA